MENAPRFPRWLFQPSLPCPRSAGLSLGLLFLFPDTFWDFLCSYPITFPQHSRSNPFNPPGALGLFQHSPDVLETRFGTRFGTFPQHPAVLGDTLKIQENHSCCPRSSGMDGAHGKSPYPAAPTGSAPALLPQGPGSPSQYKHWSQFRAAGGWWHPKSTEKVAPAWNGEHWEGGMGTGRAGISFPRVGCDLEKRGAREERAVPAASRH